MKRSVRQAPDVGTAWRQPHAVARDRSRELQALRHQSPVTPSPITPFAPVVPGYQLHFPRDDGSHPDFRIEWWYVTGWLDRGRRHAAGFPDHLLPRAAGAQARQPERVRPAPDRHRACRALRSGPRQADPRAAGGARRLRSGRRRYGAHAGVDRRLVAAQDGQVVPRQHCSTRVLARPRSRGRRSHRCCKARTGSAAKGPRRNRRATTTACRISRSAGRSTRETGKRQVTGIAWLDHEWSSQYLPEDAVGWDWIGINLDDGGALMAFRMRDKRGGQPTGRAARCAVPDGRLAVFSPDEVRFIPGRTWQSARTGITYPVSWQVKAGELELAIEPLFDDQEHDTRATTGSHLLGRRGARHGRRKARRPRLSGAHRLRQAPAAMSARTARAPRPPARSPRPSRRRAAGGRAAWSDTSATRCSFTHRGWLFLLFHEAIS